MKAYISSSLKNTEKYIITLLTMKLEESGFIVTTNFNSTPVLLGNFPSYNEIYNSHLFIGILSKNGTNKKIVLDEWKFARSKRIPHLLLVEDTIRLDPEIRKVSTVVRFNRYFPESSIEAVKEKINKPLTPISIKSRSKRVRTKTQTVNNDEAMAWVLGGAALVALIALFSEGKK